MEEETKIVLGENPETAVVRIREIMANLQSEAEKDKDERYDFTWVGKRKAKLEFAAPTNKVLRPHGNDANETAESLNFEMSENLFITGDNLQALKLLQESYLGKINIIYIDPPYNTGKDFVYHDNFRINNTAYAEQSGEIDEEGNLLVKNEKSNGRYHSDWLSMMYPRLKLARNLLADSGVICISIDDNEQANLKLLCDEVFGEENFTVNIAINKASEIASENTIQKHEYILVYSKNVLNFKVSGNPKYSISRGTVGNTDQSMPIIKFPAGLRCNGIKDGEYKETRKIEGSNENIENFDPIIVKNGKLFTPVRMKAKWRSSNDMRNFFANKCLPTVAKINGIIEEIYFENDRFNPQIKKATFEKIPSLILDNSRGSRYLEDLEMTNYFDNPKSVTVIKNLLEIIGNPSALILDFFAGSGTTAHAVMQLNANGGNRKWILVQLDETCDEKNEAFKAGYKTIDEISRERIRRAADKLGDKSGFRALKIDDNNFKAVRKSLSETKQLEIQCDVDNIKEDRTPLDLLFGCLTAMAMELNRPLETRTIEETEILLYDYRGEDSGVIACFTKSVQEKIIWAIAKLKPSTALFRDGSFETSVDKVNLYEHFRMRSPKTKVKVI
jgi:adenine-specific DNA-methyltransferase